ncbi:MAG: cob(I)yrinic acid a,c-diamide adenosyltransferase [Acidobacteriota bacterium]
MSIYTRRGDEGTTSLFSGERVDKHSLRIEVYGTVDELNSILGLAMAFCHNEKVRQVLQSLQLDLFEAGADLATTAESRREIKRMQEGNWRELEGIIDDLDKDLPRLRNFILPGGAPGGAILHLARTVCRRGERLLVHLMRQETDVNPEVLVYLNRLSDLLFVLARCENTSAEAEEVTWTGRK